MKTCLYCGMSVDMEELGALYMINEDDERVFWCHTECVEIYEGIVVHGSSS